MATSDSEDFESADEEWREDSKESLKNIASDITDDKKEESVSKSPKILGLGEGDVKVEQVAKCLEKVLSVEENTQSESIKDTKSLCTDDSKNKEEPSNNSKNTVEENVNEEHPEHDGWECEIDDLDTDLIGDISESSDVNEKDSPTLSAQKSVQESVQETPKKDFNPLLEKLSASVEKEQGSGGGAGWSHWSGWGGWGETILTTATESVTTLTTQVSQGFSNVLETGLGVPTPEELAKLEAEEIDSKEQPSVENVDVNPDPVSPDDDTTPGLFGFGRAITKLVESASNKVVYGGLDTLETIGKKTMEVLQDGDPGLRKKRALFSDKIVLSQVLRDARDKAEQDSKVLKDKEEARKAHFETLFDDYQGLIHLEALEMLSRQCNIKLQSVLLNASGSELLELQACLADVRQRCQLPEDEEDVEAAEGERLRRRLAAVGGGLGVPVASEKLALRWDDLQRWLRDCERRQEDRECEWRSREIHQCAIGGLAQLTADAVEQFHKIAELLLVQEERRPEEEAAVLLEMTGVLSSEVSAVSVAFSERLNQCSDNGEDPEVVKSYITNVFLEASNSTSYIQEAFHLLIPVMQVAAVATAMTPTS